MSALPPKADMCGATRDVCFGPQADLCSARRHVRFTPESGHVQCPNACPLWASSRLVQSSNPGAGNCGVTHPESPHCFARISDAMADLTGNGDLQHLRETTLRSAYAVSRRGS